MGYNNKNIMDNNNSIMEHLVDVKSVTKQKDEKKSQNMDILFRILYWIIWIYVMKK